MFSLIINLSKIRMHFQADSQEKKPTLGRTDLPCRLVFRARWVLGVRLGCCTHVPRSRKCLPVFAYVHVRCGMWVLLLAHATCCFMQATIPRVRVNFLVHVVVRTCAKGRPHAWTVRGSSGPDCFF